MVENLIQLYRWSIRIATLVYCVYMLLFAEVYQFMALNVLLAYIPLEISFHVKKVNKQGFFLLGMLWLLFYPNAPYLFTDFFSFRAFTHLSRDESAIRSVLSCVVVFWTANGWNMCIWFFRDGDFIYDTE